ncbi:trk system potassium uptake protein TrkH [Pseudovibrio denitrificans]|uniref:Trk system potassium uptake protein n=1 Tax=Pseudovibrio denitrificans TaxID=258256 RepID=A0A1I6ZS56_9HYPH|nr:trk system potassium uptake protein TrkH [Pseudovibrio denitrificans]
MATVGPVLRVLGYFLVGLAILMLAPALLDIYFSNPDWIAFALSSLFVGLLGLLLAVSTANYKLEHLTIRQAFLLTTTSWFVMPVCGALPFLSLGIGFENAFFESVSGFTTTGSTVLIGLDGMPPGLLFWRSLTQWIGGIGIIVMAILLMPLLRIGGMQLFRTESSDRGEKIVARATDLTRLIGGVYIMLTLTCAILYVFSGMSLFDAVNHAMTTLSSGGFSTHDASFAYFESTAAEWVAVVFMLASGLPFVVLIKSLTKNPMALLQDPQARAFIFVIIILSSMTALYLGIENKFTFGRAVVEALFVVISIITTTGYGLGDYTAWGPPMMGFFLMLTFIGGCTGSTSGGIKIFRFIVFFGTVRAYMNKMIRPDQVVPVRYGDTKITPDLAFSVLAFLVVYMATVGLITVILGGLGLDLVTAMSAATTAVSNVGPGLGDVVGPVGNFADIPSSAKIVLSAAMLLGRLELFTVLVLFNPEFWR